MDPQDFLPDDCNNESLFDSELTKFVTEIRTCHELYGQLDAAQEH